MITGTITMRRILVDLLVYGPGGQGKVPFALDTGFTAVLTLPPAACIALGLPTDRIQPSELADGTTIMLEVYIATLLWDGEERKVEALAVEGPPLIGMTLLDGYDVFLEVTEGGAVIIRRRTPEQNTESAL